METTETDVYHKKSFLKAMSYTPLANAEFVQKLWSAPDELVNDGPRLVQKNCVRTTVKFESEEFQYVVKRHLERSWRHFVKQCFSFSRAAKCWDDTWFLVRHGYPTPLPIAFRENRLGPLRGNSYYVYQYIEGRTFKEVATGLKNQRLLRKLVSQIAEIWLLHQQLGINLTDGHPANFIVDSTGKIWVIDLDKLQRIPSRIDSDSILRKSFDATIKGVIGDHKIIDFAHKKLTDLLQPRRRNAA
ncbi:MAG: lipopolysaccharide kinase InaA family protein [Planctomycetota bacterium]